jgi:hypothetical protein
MFRLCDYQVTAPSNDGDRLRFDELSVKFLFVAFDLDHCALGLGNDFVSNHEHIARTRFHRLQGNRQQLGQVVTG